ncbi:hypothetical protein GCM10025792_29930 [Pseudonocardia tropica]|uniref:DUF6924 domain-containing protein n=1 Tax=Pseudonocardia tropica TaxID=681289 RepID=UPI0031E607A0
MEFPETRRTPLVRTCSDTGEGPWNELLGILRATGTSFDVVLEDLFTGWPVERVVTSALEDGLAARHPLLLVADERALADHDFPLVVADLRGEPGRTFRIAAAVLSGFPSPRAGFADHADHAELQPDRTFRGFC